MKGNLSAQIASDVSAPSMVQVRSESQGSLAYPLYICLFSRVHSRPITIPFCARWMRKRKPSECMNLGNRASRWIDNMNQNSCFLSSFSSICLQVIAVNPIICIISLLCSFALEIVSMEGTFSKLLICAKNETK